MEQYLEDFEVESKNPSGKAIRRWRNATALVKNPRRRFRFVADLAQRSEAEKKKLQIQDSEVENKNPLEKAIRRWRNAIALVINPRRRFRFVVELAKRSEAERSSLCLQKTLSLQESQRWGSRSFPYKSDGLNTEENPSRLPLLKGFSDDKSTYYKDHNQTTGSDDSNPSELLSPSVSSHAYTDYGELGNVAMGPDDSNPIESPLHTDYGNPHNVAGIAGSDGSNLSESLLPSVSPQPNTDFGEPGSQTITVGSFRSSLAIDVDDENNDFNHPRHGTRVTRLQWIFILNGLSLEMLSAYFDQLSSPNKSQYALVSLLLAIAAVLICILEFIHNSIKEGVESTNGMVFCALPDIFGLGLSVIQCLCSAEQYYFLHRHENNPVKLSPVPLFFFCCLVVLKLK